MKVSEMTRDELDRYLRDHLPILPPEKADDPRRWGMSFSPSMWFGDAHRAEMALPDGLQRKYVATILEGRPSDWWHLLTASPRQRAEAMAKVLGGGE